MRFNENPGYPYSVLVKLFDVSQHVEGDKDAVEITRLVHEVVSHCCMAQTYLRGETATSSEQDMIQKQVMKFVQVKDKYTALGSTLLKSQAFHLVYDSKNTSFLPLPVVALPRTEYKKPYIPAKIRDLTLKDVKEENIYPMSISHQLPFVGSARLAIQEINHALRPVVGLDIVCFDDYNRRLYSNLDEFICVFRSSFTKWEWDRIHVPKASKLHELYIRWSMKEAYTKALGVGMGVSFESFSIRLHEVDDIADQGGVWSTLSVNSRGMYLSGSVIHQKDNKNAEYWDFFFLPLYKYELDGCSSNARGCACVCAGPFSEYGDDGCTRFRVEVEWTNLSSLIDWHQAT